MFSLEHYHALHQGTGLVDRSRRGRLRLTGADRKEYLQGLLTNDTAALSAGTGCYAALLTAQGRMIADMYLVETGDAIVMDLEREVSAKVFEHLDRFVITEDVQITDETASVSQIGVFGPHASTVLAAVLGLDRSWLDAAAPLENRNAMWEATPVLVVRRDDAGVAGFDLLVEVDRARSLADVLRASGAVDVDPDAVDVSRVEAGIPVFGRDMTEDTIPLEAGIEGRAISFTKGCYVGQEIIIRVLHRGQGRVARRLVGLTFDASAAVPPAGSRIRAGDREIGAVTSAVRSVALGGAIAMGYVQRDFTEPGTEVSVIDGDSILAAVVSALPFTPASRAVPSA
jgi:folate-binding protein YgfZ